MGLQRAVAYVLLRRRQPRSDAVVTAIPHAHVAGSGITAGGGRRSGRPASSVKARLEGSFKPVLAKTDPTPAGVNFTIVLFLTFPT